jgi:septal ring factor EnvC (AmiA/AmiB activator)
VVAADEEREAREAELAAVRARIDSLQAHLAETRAAREDHQAQLRALETQASAVEGELQRIARALADGEARLVALAEEQRGLERDLARQREALAGQVRATYILGRRGYLALLLNQEDPDRVGRALAYHRYVQRGLVERLQAVEARLAEVAEVGREIEGERANLLALQGEQGRARAVLAEQRQARTEVLARIQETLGQTGAEVARLAADARQLEGLIESLKGRLPDIPETLEPARPFAELRGALPWPVTGGVRVAFGSPRPGGLTAQGMVIAAPAGAPVRAVHAGRVAFADWLRGLGLLVILDHGDGFMSLYGHNRQLLRAEGDWVGTGDAVATVGDSGGSAEAGLYFEVRHQGTPLDPARWCRGSPASG